MSPRPSHRIRYSRLLMGASAATLLAAAGPALAGGSSPYPRVANPAAAAAQAAAAQVSQTTAASAAVAQAQASFAQAAAIRSQMDAAQAAARAAAVAAQSAVPNGLAPGGLQAAQGAAPGTLLWQGADLPTQTTASNGRTQVNVQQTSSQAILNWQTFNVGQQTDLSFSQQASNWVVLNRVTDPAANPSRILGTVTAPGTVLVLNRNGVIFGGASQVNVGSLVAGAASMTDTQFLTNGIYSAQANNLYTPSFTDAAGAVTVQAGAQISTNAPSSVTQGGGYVLLLGSRVQNGGQIMTPGGQTELAAGDAFLVRPGLGTTANTTSTTRGNEVAIQLATPGSSLGGGAGLVSNSGLIQANTGDVTLAGETVINSGVLLASTSVNTRGTIHLLSPFNDPFSSVTLAPGSLAAIVADTSGATALDSQRAALISASGSDDYDAQSFNDLSQLADRQDQSRVEIVTGGNVEFQGNSLTLANGGQVAVSAAGRVQVDTGATIDVSGLLNVALPMSDNVITVNVQGNELRDDPNNRDSGDLANSNLYVDARDLILVPAGTGGYASNRYYTAGGLLEVSGYLGTTGHTIQEWQAVGGTITLSGAEVVAQSKSVFNIAGGSVQYQGGYLPQSYVQATNGLIYNVNDAPANLTYTGVYSGFTEAHSRWGVTKTYSNPLLQPSKVYQPGYTVGRDAGTLVLSTPTAVFEGDIVAGATTGLQQTAARPAGVTDPYALPQNVAPLGGVLAIGQYGGFGLAGAYDTDVVFGDFAPIASGLGLTTALPGERTGTAWLDAGALSAEGLGGLNIVTAGDITVLAPLTLSPGAQVVFTAPDVRIGSTLTAQGGQASLGNLMHTQQSQISAVAWAALTDADGASSVLIDTGATVDLSGTWTNAHLEPRRVSGQAFMNGGDLSVSTTGSVTLAAGATIDVSAGAVVSASGKTKGGAGGDVSLVADDYSKLQSAVQYTADLSQPLILDGTIKGYGFSGGGTLTLGAGQTVVIGQDASISGGSLAAGTAAKTSVALAQATTIPAGAVMPVDYVVTQVDVPLDTPLTQALTPRVSGTTPVTTAAAWTVPANMSVATSGHVYNAGATVPAGSAIVSMPAIPAGTTLPSAVFAEGVPLSSPYLLAAYKAGDVLTAPVTLPAGFTVPTGAVFAQAVAIKPALTLSPGLFQSGFSHYAISSNAGVEVSDGTVVAPVVPIYQFGAASLAAPTGSSVAEAASLWLPPIFRANPVNDTVVQRAGADLTLSSLQDLTIGSNASLTVDPGQSVTLFVNGQATILGDITAHGGAITVNSLQDSLYGAGYGAFSLTRSIWIGDGARLDVSGQAFTATDARGRVFGQVQDGGSIRLGGDAALAGDAFVVVRPGALLDASGATANLDILDLANGQVTQRSVQDSSDGGLIALASGAGVYLDGQARAAAGGPGAAGGTLEFDLISHIYNTDSPSVLDPYGAAIQPAAFLSPSGMIGVVPTAAQGLRNITLVQDNAGSGLADQAPGQSDQGLAFGHGVLGANQIAAGGFDSVSLNTRDLFVFKGDLDLQVGRSLTLSGGMMVASNDTPHVKVALAAPYVHLTGWDADGTITTSYYPGLNTDRGPSLHTAADSSFSVSADLIDLDGTLQFGVHAHQGSGPLGQLDVNHAIAAPQANDITTLTAPDIVDLPGFNQVTFSSTGDIRFGSGVVQADNVTLQAAQVYPLSGAQMAITAGFFLAPNTSGGIGNLTLGPNGVIAIRGLGGAAPAVPASAFGGLSLEAADIEQDGVVRAPLGLIAFEQTLIGGSPIGTGPGQGNVATTVHFGADSVTSVSADGLTMPYGGTTDGVSYAGIGALQPLGATEGQNSTLPFAGIVVGGSAIRADKGAVLDLSGGGDLTGAGFISGRGGSVDVLTTALVNANPAAASYSASGDKVYAIVPGYASAYAPAIAAKGAGDPAVGQQITIGAGVPGLAAGVYTLLPSSYALLPGGFRVELGGAVTATAGAVGLANGSTVTTGTLSVANTGIHGALPVQVVLSPGDAVRKASQYNETSYSDFAKSQAAVFGGVRPYLPEDGKVLQFNIGLDPTTHTDSLVFNGEALFGGKGDDSVSGTMILESLDFTPGNVIDITAPGAAPTAGHVTIASDVINAFNASTVLVGGGVNYFIDTSNFAQGPRLYFAGQNSVINVLSGADVRAGQVFLAGNAINVASGATIDTHGLDASGIDSTLGYVYSNVQNPSQSGPAVLGVANGWFNFLPVYGSGAINIASGAKLLTDGSIVLAAPGGLTMGDVDLGARYIAVSQNTIDIGSADSLAAAAQAGVLPAGWRLTQDVLDTLLKPPAESGLPALQSLTLTAGGSINFIGSAAMDASGQGGGSVQLVFNTPAIYGLGGAGDVASLKADTLVWNGIRTGNGGSATPTVPYGSQAPAPITAGGPGTGQGTLDIEAQDVVFGYDANSRPTDGTTLNRVAVGFSSVKIAASDKITANSDGTLTVGQSLNGSGAPVGGDLTLTTPLITAEKGANLAITAGGAITIAAPSGAAPAATAPVEDIGGTIAFTSGAGLTLDTAVAMPSGQLTLNAAGDISLGVGANVDLSGRSLVFDDQTQYSWGGNLVMTSASGSIRQDAGATIDVSAVNNNAGAITATADQGVVDLAGALKGSASGDGAQSGQITLAGQSLGDFAALNAALDAGGVHGLRSFDVRQGDLTVGDVNAQSVTISVDGGSLSVQGRIDASGPAPGTIRLSARDDLTLGGSAVLDAHGTTLQTDSYGVAIDASNTAHVELSAANGAVTLSAGATIDMTTPDGVARGQLVIDAPRLGGAGGTGAGANDVAVNAAGPLNIAGAGSIAVNAFRTYDLAGGSAIDQALLDGYDADSTAFIDAAYGNNVAGGQLTANLQGKLSGLLAYGSAFHLRPGVQITSSGDLSTSGDLDLSGYRYGPGVDPSVRGSGEPGDLVIRAAGSLDINGSINDGFAPPPASPDSLTVLLGSQTLTANYTVTASGAVLAAGSKLLNNERINVPLTFPAGTRMITTPTSAHPLPAAITLTSSFTVGAAGRVVTGTIFNPNGTVMFASGSTLPNGAVFPVGTTVAAGTYFSAAILATTAGHFFVFGPVTIPANADLLTFGGYTFNQNTSLPIGTVLPSGMTVTTLTGAGNRKLWAISPMLAPGAQSWSMRLVGGADLGDADSRGLLAASSLNGSGDVVLNDPAGVDLAGTGRPGVAVSVVRTGTGSLEILAGGDYIQSSPFGVYTAGTAIPETGTAANAPYNPARGLLGDGTVLGAANSAYESTLNSQYMYFTQGGGDVLVSAQGNIVGSQTADALAIGGWLWREGGDGVGQATAWGVNFGSYTAQMGLSGATPTPYVGLSAFSGIGALGGGNVTLAAGGDIGDAGHGVVAAVGGSGRVTAGGALLQTGGGALTVTAGGNIGTGGNQFVDLRGNTNVLASDFGSITGVGFGYDGGNDPRRLDPLKPYAATIADGGSFAPGDGIVTVRARGDLAMGAIFDPGRDVLEQNTAASTSAQGSGQGVTWFTLWTDRTALDLYGGGNVAPFSTLQARANTGEGGSSLEIPAILTATAADGDIYVAVDDAYGMMAPSPDGALNLYATDSVIGLANIPGGWIGPVSTSLSAVPTPFHPAWELLKSPTTSSTTILASNFWGNPTGTPDVSSSPAYSISFNGNVLSGAGGTLFAFGPDTVTDDSAAPAPGVVSHIYARDGDILGLNYGREVSSGSQVGGVNVVTNYYQAAKPVQMLAGGDIVNLTGVILQDDPNDVSMLAAGGNVVYAGMQSSSASFSGLQIAGPGTLEVTAGGSIYEGYLANIDSIGPLIAGDKRPGANIVLQAGVGAGAPGVGQVDWSGFAALYLNPANQADAVHPDTDPVNAGKVPYTYQGELYAWLQQNYGYAGDQAGAFARFEALPAPQQRVFLREVYYDELNAGGLEYNDPASKRFRSYLRGRDAIAALFPDQDAYKGDITLFSAVLPNTHAVQSGYVHTDFGGNIQFLAPGGQVQVGTEGLAPGAAAGLITQGAGDIQIYSDDSVLLGLSRIMTTFGGDVLIWSATGDINAGRGAKTTVVFTPPKRVYDDYGQVTLSPVVPSTGAGIATLAPIPQVPPGDVNLIAPLGTIDAGEAGIRVSGNLNVAALQVVNAANIQVQGTATGLPEAVAVNVGALTSASGASAAVTQIAQQMAGQRPPPPPAPPAILTIRLLGFGDPQ